MLYQTDDEFIEEIQEYGCLFLSIAYYKTKHYGYEWTHKELNSLWITAKARGYINKKCEIEDYVRILSLLGINLRYLDKHAPVQEIDSNAMFAVTKWHNPNNDYNHFVVGTAKPVEYDPFSSGGSKTIREGYPVDMRLFARPAA
jgi:hypothetical protein